MEKSISSKDLFTTGAFIINDEGLPFVPFTKIQHLYLTQEGNNSLKEEILRIIKEANEVIKICSFIITDREIFDAILERTKSNNIAVFILTQLDTKKLSNTSLITDEEAKDQTNILHLSYIKNLYENGAHVRASTSAHAKFIIADRNLAFIMSANLTTPSLTLNTESGLYLNRDDAECLDNLFDVIFQKGTTYRQYISSLKKNKQFVIQSEMNVKSEWLPDHKKTNLKYSYENLTKNLYEKIVSTIQEAKEFIFLSTYSIVGLENLPEFKLEIKNAISRGVEISVFCRGMNYRSDHLKGSKELAELGCKIYGDVYNHSKGILNENSGLIFTANIDGYHGLVNGFEIGCVIDSNQRLEFLEFHKFLIQTSLYIFQLNPVRSKLFAAYTKYEQLKGIRPPIFENEVKFIVKQGINCLKEELEGMPIFYGKTNGNISEEFLIVGGSCYKCNYQKGTFHIIEKSVMNFNLEKYILKFNNLIINYN